MLALGRPAVFTAAIRRARGVEPARGRRHFGVGGAFEAEVLALASSLNIASSSTPHSGYILSPAEPARSTAVTSIEVVRRDVQKEAKLDFSLPGRSRRDSN